jgi:hypothetical protein
MSGKRSNGELGDCLHPPAETMTQSSRPQSVARAFMMYDKDLLDKIANSFYSLRKYHILPIVVILDYISTYLAVDYLKVAIETNPYYNVLLNLVVAYCLTLLTYHYKFFIIPYAIITCALMYPVAHNFGYLCYYLSPDIAIHFVTVFTVVTCVEIIARAKKIYLKVKIMRREEKWSYHE